MTSEATSAPGEDAGAPGNIPAITRDHARSRAIAYVFQDAHLLPWRNVLKNVALPLELKGVGRAERLSAAAEAIEQVGLSDAAGRFPNQLSGGMRMRVSLARAMVTRPEAAADGRVAVSGRLGSGGRAQNQRNPEACGRVASCRRR